MSKKDKLEKAREYAEMLLESAIRDLERDIAEEFELSEDEAASVVDMVLTYP